MNHRRPDSLSHAAASSLRISRLHVSLLLLPTVSPQSKYLNPTLSAIVAHFETALTDRHPTVARFVPLDLSLATDATAKMPAATTLLTPIGMSKQNNPIRRAHQSTCFDVSFQSPAMQHVGSTSVIVLG